jgi:hypothetical protein
MTYFIITLLSAILIEALVIIIQTLRVRYYKNKDRRNFNQKLIDRQKFVKQLRRREKENNEKIENAKTVDDIVDLHANLMRDDDNNN